MTWYRGCLLAFGGEFVGATSGSATAELDCDISMALRVCFRSQREFQVWVLSLCRELIRPVHETHLIPHHRIVTPPWVVFARTNRTKLTIRNDRFIYTRWLPTAQPSKSLGIVLQETQNCKHFGQSTSEDATVLGSAGSSWVTKSSLHVDPSTNRRLRLGYENNIAICK